MPLLAVWLAVYASLASFAAHAVPMVALQSLVVLGSSPSHHCVAAALSGGLFLTPSTCSLDALDAVRVVAEVAFVEADASDIQLALHETKSANLSVVWSDNVTRVLRHGGGEANATSLALPSQALTLPSALEEDKAVTMIEVHATTLRVSAIDEVIYVDNALCGAPATTTSAASVCVLPLKLQDRDAVLSSDSFRFLVKRDSSTGSHILLGLGLPTPDEDTHTGFRRFTWLAGNLQDASFARVFGLPAAESDRLIISGLTRTDTRTEYIADIRDADDQTACTGVLVAPKAVLTSRQCTNLSLTNVVLGARDPSTKSTQELLPILSKIVHKRYDAKTGAFDGLLLRLKTASSRTPLALLSDASVSVVGKTGRVFGYGLMLDKKGTPVVTPGLRVLDVPIGPANDVCSKRVGSSLDGSKLCTGGAWTPDGCFNPGDTGAPLVVDAGTTSQRLVGILYDGRACGEQDGVSVFTRVASIMTLIREGIKRSNLPTTKTRAPSTAARAAENAALFEETGVATRA